MAAITREELAERCESTSFDNVTMDYENKKVVYLHSFRDAQGVVLEEFRTEVHFSELEPRPLTAPEERALLSFGLCHSTYVYLAAAKRAPLLQIRAGYFSPAELAFFRPALSGALAEYFFLADLDLATLQLECCCSPSTTQQSLKSETQISSASPAPPESSQPQSATAGEAHAATEVTTDGSASIAENPDNVTPSPSRRPPRVLVPFGGGKDSTLLMELLSRLGAEVGWVYYGEWVGSWEVYSKFARLAAASPASSVVLVEQALPCLDRLKELNLVPELRFEDYSAYVSFYTFVSAFVALQQDFTYICVGNENSANAINTTHPRHNYPVNHQYEKSFEAERAFHDFLRDHIHPRLYYFSGLQHMTELEIAARFASVCAAKYLHLIISCNWAMDDDWCGGCEKCAFVFLLFAAFLPVPEIMSKVFGVPPRQDIGPEGDTSSAIVPGSRESLSDVYDMYDSVRHLPVFESLMGLSGHKPFECVGTPEECLAALYLMYERLYGSGANSTVEDGAASAATVVGTGAAAIRVSSSEEDTPGGECAGDEGQKLNGTQEAERSSLKHQEAGSKLPLLLRKHLGLITTKGKQEWEKIRATMQAVEETGQAGVPTLYPEWFRLSGSD